VAMYLVLLALGAALAAVLLRYAIRWPRGRRRDEPVGYCRCPHCRQKLRYRAHQVGGRALCPSCVRAFHFPRPAPGLR
jgi:hypothetical protein